MLITLGLVVPTWNMRCCSSSLQRASPWSWRGLRTDGSVWKWEGELKCRLGRAWDGKCRQIQLLCKLVTASRQCRGARPNAVDKVRGSGQESFPHLEELLMFWNGGEGGGVGTNSTSPLVTLHGKVFRSREGWVGKDDQSRESQRVWCI